MKRITINIEKISAIPLFIKLKDQLIQAGVNFISDTTFEYDETDVNLTRRIKDIFTQNCPNQYVWDKT